MEIAPKTRLAIISALLIGILACQSVPLLLLFFASSLLFASFRGRWRDVLLSLVRASMPTVPILFLVWGAMVPTSSASDGLRLATLASLRLLALLSLLLLAFGELDPDALARQLRQWGVGTRGIAAVLGILTLWPEVQRRANEIMEARYARGLLRRRSIWQSAQSLPIILRPLITWSLRSAIARAESWERRGIVARLGEGESTSSPDPAGAPLLGVAILWTSAALWF